LWVHYTLGTAASDGISLWNARTCAPIKHLPAGPGYPYAISFSPDGKLLAFALEGSVIEILDTNSGEVLQKLNGVHDYAEYIRFSPDGRFLATISRSLDPAKTEAILIVWRIADDSQQTIELSPAFFEPAK
jgi:WD40 repeat protein